jgi:hypothetical protein
MSRKVTVTLTRKEAMEMFHALGNSLDSGDEDLMSLFNGDRRSITAALRAQKKVAEAIYRPRNRRSDKGGER